MRSNASWPALGWSLIIGAIVALIKVVLGGLGGYAFSRYPFRGARIGYFMLIALAGRDRPGDRAPVLHRVPAARSAQHHVGADDRGIAFTLPISVWVLKTYFDTVPPEIEEAAMIDGAGTLPLASRVIVAPLAKPGLIAAGLLAFLEAWSEFFAPVLTDQPDRATGGRRTAEPPAVLVDDAGRRDGR